MEENRVVIKASAAIQHENTISLLARRVWTALLYHAYDQLPYSNKHTIRIDTLKEIIEFDSKNDEYLKQTLRELNRSQVQWNVLGKDQEWEWGTTTLLAGATIKKGVCTFDFGSILSERLHNPNLYARIHLSIQNKFESKHALALWELCLDYLNDLKNYGETPLMTVAMFRQLMGIRQDQYVQFKLLNLKVIKEPLEEINSKTDFRITVEYKRVKRRIEYLKFRFRLVSPAFDEHSQQPTLFEDGVGNTPELVKELRNAGVPLDTAWDIWQNAFDKVEAEKRPQGIDFDTYVREKIALLKQANPQKIRNAAGFLIDAIRQNWVPSQRVDKTIATTARRKPTRKTTRRQSEGEQYATLIRQFPELLEKLLDPLSLREDQPFLFRQFREDLDSQTALWNYDHHPSLAAYAEEKLRQIQTAEPSTDVEA